MNNLLLKLHAWFYRRTGIYTKYAKRREKEHIEELSKSTELTPLVEDIAIGTWQAKHRFYRSFKKVLKKEKMGNKLIKGQSYTNNKTDLALKVLSNVFKSTTKLKFKGLLYNKKNSIVYETKQYQIDKDTPKTYNWRLFNETDT